MRFGSKMSSTMQMWSKRIDKNDLARLESDAQVLGDSAVGHESNTNLVLAITHLHFRRLCRTLLPKSFVRMLMPECIQ